MKNLVKERIRELRKESGMNQTQLAKALKTYQANISRWEKGLDEPNIDNIIRLCELLNTTADYLLGLSDY